MKEAMKQHSSLILSIVVVALAAFGLYWLATADNRQMVKSNPIEGEDELQYSVNYLIKMIDASIAASEAIGEEVHLDTYASLAHQYNLLGEYERARDYTALILERNPVNYSAWASYADISFSMKDYDEAEIGYQKAVELLPTNTSYWRDFLEFYEFRYPEQADERFTYLELAVENAGQDTFFMQELSEYYESVGDCDRAIRHMEIAVDNSLSPEDAQKDLDALEARCDG